MIINIQSSVILALMFPASLTAFGEIRALSPQEDKQLLNFAAHHDPMKLGVVSPDGKWQTGQRGWQIPSQDAPDFMDRFRSIPGIGKERLTFSYRWLENLKTGETFVPRNTNVASKTGPWARIIWSPEGKWFHIENRLPMLYLSSELPECLVEGRPYQNYMILDKEVNTPIANPFLNSFPTMAVWISDDLLYTSMLPKYTDPRAYQGAYLMRHLLDKQEVDFFLRSMKEWEKLVAKAEATDDPQQYYADRFVYRSSYEWEDEKALPLKPIKVNFVKDEIPKEFSEHKITLEHREAFRKTMREQ